MPTIMTLEIPKFIGASTTLSTEVASITSNGQPNTLMTWKQISVIRDSDKHTHRFLEIHTSGAHLAEVFLYLRVEKQNKLTHLQVIRLKNVTITGVHFFAKTETIEFEAEKVKMEQISMDSPAAWTGF